jgi:hypothetical protein
MLPYETLQVYCTIHTNLISPLAYHNLIIIVKRLTAEEAISWMRIARPGCVIGSQQFFMKIQEPRMWRQARPCEETSTSSFSYIDEISTSMTRLGIRSIAVGIEKRADSRSSGGHYSSRQSDFTESETQADALLSRRHFRDAPIISRTSDIHASSRVGSRTNPSTLLGQGFSTRYSNGIPNRRADEGSGVSASSRIRPKSASRYTTR